MGTLTAAEAGWQKQPFYCWWLIALSKSSKLRRSAKWDSWTPPMLTWLSRLLAPHLPESNLATSHRFKRSLHSSGVRPPQDMAFLHCSVGLAGSWCMPQIAPNPVGSALPAASMGAIWNAGLEPQTCPRLTVAASWSNRRQRRAGRRRVKQQVNLSIVYISNRVLVRLRRASVIKRVVTISMHVWSVCSLHCAFGSFALATSFARSLPLSTCPMAVGLACNHFFFITWIEYRICISMHILKKHTHIYIYILFKSYPSSILWRFYHLSNLVWNRITKKTQQLLQRPLIPQSHWPEPSPESQFFLSFSRPTSISCERVAGDASKSQFYLGFGRPTSISCERVAFRGAPAAPPPP